MLCLVASFILLAAGPAGTYKGTYSGSAGASGDFVVSLTQADGGEWKSEVTFTLGGADVKTKITSFKVDGVKVKIVYERDEDIAATTKRHPAIVRHKTGVTRDGRLTAIDIDALFDGGAYATLSAVVLSRGVIHASGPYRCDHVRIHGRATMTNTPPNGAFRGFGAPQTQFAVEVHMERIAEALKMDPVVLRDTNALRPGDTTATVTVLVSRSEPLRRTVTVTLAAKMFVVSSFN
jgi:CO/xanthine dehydrogenase Mo-binding subunit